MVSRYLQNQKKSSLLRLPGEIRNQIYGYVLGGYDVYTYKVSLDGRMTHILECSKNDTTGEGATSWEETVQFTTVCRQIQEESRLLPFELNIFNASGKSFEEWFALLNEDQRNAITTLSFGRRYRMLHFEDLLLPSKRFWKCTGVKKVILFGKLEDNQRRKLSHLIQGKDIVITEKIGCELGDDEDEDDGEDIEDTEDESEEEEITSSQGSESGGNELDEMLQLISEFGEDEYEDTLYGTDGMEYSESEDEDTDAAEYQGSEWEAEDIEGESAEEEKDEEGGEVEEEDLE